VAPVNDLHHKTFLTADMDRLISFYERIFDARVTLDREDDGGRHAVIEIGPQTVLHPFEVPSADVPPRQPIFERGHGLHAELQLPRSGRRLVRGHVGQARVPLRKI
jgi:catechol 2,3-dioxygenase-like lactoylglutathione lyase family enzyme